MIKIIYGPKGTGKTKILIDEANAKVAAAKGHMIFITNTKRYMYDLHRDIRVIDTNDFFSKGKNTPFEGKKVYGRIETTRIAGKEIKEMAEFYYMLDKLSEENGLTIYVTCSCAKEDLPDFVAKYL